MDVCDFVHPLNAISSLGHPNLANQPRGHAKLLEVVWAPLRLQWPQDIPPVLMNHSSRSGLSRSAKGKK